MYRSRELSETLAVVHSDEPFPKVTYQGVLGKFWLLILAFVVGPAIYITLLFVDTDGYKFYILDEFANCGHSSIVLPSSAPKIDIFNSFSSFARGNRSLKKFYAFCLVFNSCQCTMRNLLLWEIFRKSYIIVIYLWVNRVSQPLYNNIFCEIIWWFD